MVVLKTLVYMLLSIPAVDNSLPPSEEVIRCRMMLVHEGMPAKEVDRLLRLDRLRWLGGHMTDEVGVHNYIVPPGRCLTIVYDVRAELNRIELH